MKKFLILFSILFTFISSGAEVPVFSEKVPLKTLDGADITGGFISPLVCDWNEDGKKDLIAGVFFGGRIRFYENVGTDDNPQLKPYINMKAGGVPISNGAG